MSGWLVAAHAEPLKHADITKVGEVLEMSDTELLRIRDFGDNSLREVREKLVEGGSAKADRQASARPEDKED